MLSLDRQNTWRERYRQRRPSWRPATEHFAELVRVHLRPTSRVLDLGCGRGGLIEQLVADGFPLQQAVGIDPDRPSLKEHRLRILRAQALSSDLPFAAGSFDLIYSSWLLEHLTHPAQDFAQIRRVLRPTGVFVFLTPNRRHPLAALNQLLGRSGKLQGRLVERFYGRSADDAFPTYYRANTPADLRRLAQESDLRLTCLDFVPDPSYLALNLPMFHIMSWFEERLPPARRLHLVGALTPASST